MTRKWSLILTGPNSGVIAPFGDVWAHCPPHFERVTIRELLEEEEEVPVVSPLAPPAVPMPAPKEPSAIVANEPVDAIARSLGIVFNDLIPHNAGWFVPGYQRAFSSAADAVRAMFAVLKSQSLSRAELEALPEHAQPRLF